MTGFLIINHFLCGEKFNTLHNHLIRTASKMQIDLQIRTNLEMLFEKRKADFVLFWDKDVSLAKKLELEGQKVFNSSESIALCDNKAATYLALKNTVNQPKTIIAPLSFFDNSDYTDFIDKAAQELGLPLIMKGCFGSFGEQVFLCRTKEEIAKNICGKPFLLQQYIKSSHGNDIRLEIINGVCVAAMKRENKNDFRSNITNGGTMQHYDPTDEEIAAAVKAANKLGLLFCGVDILDGNLLCEVNSNAHIINIMECTKKDVAPLIFETILEKIR